MVAAKQPRARRRRTERRQRTRRMLAIAAAFLTTAVILWIWVFPWLDRTFVNRPSVGGG